MWRMSVIFCNKKAVGAVFITPSGPFLSRVAHPEAGVMNTAPTADREMAPCKKVARTVCGSVLQLGYDQRYKVRSLLREARRVPSGDQAMAESVHKKEGEHPCQQKK